MKQKYLLITLLVTLCTWNTSSLPAGGDGTFDTFIFALPGAENGDSLINSANGVSSLSAYGQGAERESRLIEVSELPLARERPANRARAINFGDDASSRGSNNIKLRDSPINLDDKDAFLFPDKFEQLKENGIAVDSYGRPVTPFPLSEEDVQSRAGSFKDSNGFVIPSYASGIAEFVDPNLPIIPKKPFEQVRSDLTSGPAPQASSQSVKVDQSQLPSDSLLPPLNIPSTFNQPPPALNEILVPLNGLLPPFGENGPNSGAEQPVAIVIVKPPPPKTVTPTPTPATERTTITTTTRRPQIVVPQLPQSLSPPNVATPSRDPFNAPPPPPPSSQNVGSRTGASSFVVSTPTFTQQRLQNVATVTTVKKYTGGFGGAPGLLGNGQPGFAITADGRVDPSKIQVQRAAPSSVSSVSAPAPTVGFTFVGNVNQPLPSVQPQNRFDASVSRYTGGFGGPPGLLVPFDHISTFARQGEE